MKNQRGITLISLVITIVVLIILAGVAISMTLGENGIFNKAQEAKKMQAIATAKEQIGLEILEAQIEAMENNKELEQTEVEAIVAKYGVLQADGDTIILNDTEYEVSLREIYNEMAEEEGDETTELAQLKALLAQTTVTEDKMLKDYKAYKDGQLITGTIENYAGQTVEAITITESGENALITIPENGYYSTSSKISVPVNEVNTVFSKEYTAYTIFNNSNVTTTKEIKVKKDACIIIQCTVRASANQNSQAMSAISKLIQNGVVINPSYSYDDKITVQSGTDDGSGNRMHVYIINVKQNDVLNISTTNTGQWGWFLNRCIIYAPVDFTYE